MRGFATKSKLYLFFDTNKGGPLFQKAQPQAP